jgi:DNA modification methylase
VGGDRARLYQGDCLEVMKGMEPDSIDLILTSPPYDNLRKYAAGSSFDFEATAAECKRLLKPGGVLVWVVGDQTKDGDESGTSFRQALHFKSIGLRLHDTMAYGKKNPVPKSTPHRRYEQAFEFMFVLTKGKPKTFNALTEPSKQAGVVRVTAPKHRRCGHDPVAFHGAGRPIKAEKLRSNIWYYSVKYVTPIGHPATFPLQLAIDHILSWTDPGDTVLDPFVGSGTVLEACIKTGRHGIGIEKAAEYHPIIRRRIAAALASTPQSDPDRSPAPA